MRLKILREELGVTQCWVAQYLHCDQSLYSKYEREEREIPVWILIKLSDLYNTSTDYLLDLTEIKEKYPAHYNKDQVL